MAAVWTRARAELRHRWRATLLLVVLVGLAGGVVLAAVAGARRTATVMDRFLAWHRATNVGVAVEGLDPGAVRRLPQVADIAEGGYLAMVAATPSGGPDPDSFGEINPYVGLGGSWPGSSNRLILVAGRLPFGDRPLEARSTRRWPTGATWKWATRCACGRTRPSRPRGLVRWANSHPSRPAGRST
jgi:putative ABC transport system permease protein